MATKTSKIGRLLLKHKPSFQKDVDLNKLVSKLTHTGTLSKKEEEVIFECSDNKQKADIFVEILCDKGSRAFHDFCAALEEYAPHLLTRFLLDSSPDSIDKTPTHALQLSYELALKERDEVLRENAKATEERDEALRKAGKLQMERDKILANLRSLTQQQKNIPQIEKSSVSPLRHNKEKLKVVDSDLETEIEESSDNVVWEMHRVTLTRVPGFGFGIAVSGGKDNPHFANGDPSIAISDVLKAGPAEGKLQINDRVLSVNSISLQDVDHATAITVLKDSGSTVNLVIKRRIVLPASLENETPPLKITLTRKNKKDEYGVVLGCRFFVKEITPYSLAAQECGIKEGDTILKINNAPIETLSLVDAKKLIDKCKDKIQLIITKKRTDSKRKDDEYSLGYGTMQSTLPKHADNMYRVHGNMDEDPYKIPISSNDIPVGTYPANSLRSRLDGRYVSDIEAAPPRPPLPTGLQSVRSPSPMKDGYYSDKENMRRQKSMGISQTGQEIPDSGLMRRHHDERYIGKRKDIRADPRLATFRKDPELGLGLRLAGGNSTGIFIASVQPGSEAELVGLTEGDQIIKANDKEIICLTREEAVTYLTSLEGIVTMVVQYKKEAYDRIMTSQEAGDSFYIRTHFNYEQQEPGELSFVQGDIFHIKDTLFRGAVGSWLAVRMGRNNQETQQGIIPNRNRAEQLAISSQSTSEDDKDNTQSKSRGLFAKRKAARRSKSLSKDHWEEVIFSHLQTRFPAYERVVLKDPGFVRPIVVFGPMADVARERILKDFPDKYQSPYTESHVDDEKTGRSGIIRFGAIKEIISKRKHCLLDITPHNVDRLNFSQLYPIVIFLKSDCKATVKELRSKWAKGSSKTPKKLYELSLKLEKYYQHLFTANVTHNTSETWYKKLVDIVDLQQQQQIWMSEKKLDEDVSDDYLFPMSNRMSFSGNHESDTDITRALDDNDMSMVHKKRFLVRSSSDPSVNTSERVPGIPPYPDPPRYQRSPKTLQDSNQNYQEVAYDDSYTQRSEDRFYPSYYADHSDIDRHGRINIDPYATITPSERLRGGRMPSDSQWNDGYDDHPPQSPQPADALYSKPLRRQHQSPQAPPSSSPHEPSSSYNQQLLNQPSSPLPHNLQPQLQYNDSSSYSSDSLSKYTSNPANKHDDSKLREKLGQTGNRPPVRGSDPYRFTRSTATKVSATNVDKTKLSDLSAKFRNEPAEKVKLSNTSLNSTKPQKPTADTNARGAVVDSSTSAPNSSDQRTVRKLPPPVPVKTYSVKDRGIEPDEQKIRNYENTNLRGYEYRENNPYSSFPPGREPSSKYRSYSNDDRFLEQSSPGVEHYKSEDPYEWVAPRYHSGNKNQRPANKNSEFRDGFQQKYNQNGRSFVNQIYMDHSELMQMREHGVYNGPPEWPRTDDKMRRLQQTRPFSKSSDHVNKQTNGNKCAQPKDHFSSYKKLISPEVYSSSKLISKSHDELRDEQDSNISHQRTVSAPTDQRDSQTGSAFETYNKPPLSNFGKLDSSPAKMGSDARTLPRKGGLTELSTVDEGLEQDSFVDQALVEGDQIEISVDQKEADSDQKDAESDHVINVVQSDFSHDQLVQSHDQESQSDTGSTSTPDTVIYQEGFDPTQEVDENHTVVATARGVFTSKGGILESPETGVSIVIPQGALPDHVEQEIYFKVCRDNSILPPLDREKGETLLSPLVMCGPHGLKFNEPVELRLPHCASVNPDSWSFALKSSDSPTGHPTQWQNMNLAEKEGPAQSRVGKNSVSVLVDHF